MQHYLSLFKKITLCLCDIFRMKMFTWIIVQWYSRHCTISLYRQHSTGCHTGVRPIDSNDVTRDSSRLIRPSCSAENWPTANEPKCGLNSLACFCVTSNVNDAAKSSLIIRLVQIGTSWTFCFGRGKLKNFMLIKAYILNVDIE